MSTINIGFRFLNFMISSKSLFFKIVSSEPVEDTIMSIEDSFSSIS